MLQQSHPSWRNWLARSTVTDIKTPVDIERLVVRAHPRELEGFHFFLDFLPVSLLPGALFFAHISLLLRPIRIIFYRMKLQA
jgi:hypothetical protein